MSPKLPAPDPVEPVAGLDEPTEAPAPETPETPAADAAPRRGRPTTRAARAEAAAARRAEKAAAKEAAPARPKVTAADVRSSVEALHGMVGAGLPFVGLPQTGAAVEAVGKPAGEVWADAVKRYPKLEVLFGAGTDGLIVFRLLMIYAPLVQLGINERAQAGPAPDLAATMAGLMGAVDLGEAPPP